MFKEANKKSHYFCSVKKSAPTYIVAWPQGYKTIFMLTQLSMKFSLLIDMKMSTVVGIFIFIS